MEKKILRLEDILPLFNNDNYDNIMIFNTEEQEEHYRGSIDNLPMHTDVWIVESWELQLINGEPYICFNATWNDWDY